MEIVFYALSFIGSFSIGYGILRAGFPEKQSLQAMEKLGYGYGIGAIIFIPGLIAAGFFGGKGFLAISSIMLFILFAAMLAKRYATGETDSVPIQKEKRARPALPRKVMAEEEKSGGAVQVVSASKIGEQIFKEKEPNVIAEVRKKTSEMEQKKRSEEKDEALKRLRNFARDIKIKESKSAKKKKAEDDELEEMVEFEE